MFFNNILIMTISVLLKLNKYNLMMYFFMFFFSNMFMFNMILEYKNYNMIFDLDNLTYMMIMLSNTIILLIMLFSYSKFKMNNFLYYLFLNMMMFLSCCFLLNNFLLMYMFFEFSLIPLIILIFTQGNNKERIIANFYLITYTLFGSLYFLLLIIFLNKNNLNLSMKILNIMFNLNSILWKISLIIFIIKMPLFMFHIWLPQAHVEASVEGSMILAAVALKLGSYGMFRLFNFLNMKFNSLFIILLINIGLMGALLSTLICFRHTDIKNLIAFSSISHMSFLTSSILTLNKISSLSALSFMIAHGFTSSLMFFLANLLYKNYNSRNTLLMKGLMTMNPLMSFFWLLINMMNMGVPPFLNFFSELMMIFSIMKFSIMLIFLLILILFMNTIYSLNLFTRICHGNYLLINNMKSYTILTMKNKIIIMMHFFFLIIYLLMNNMIFKW